jgi:dTDP-glucose pyrophosphorylase/CBS domain-containing protein
MKFIDNIKTIIIKPDTFIKKAINIINKNGVGIVVVVDQKKRLLGTITDGDIRRAILNNIDLFDNVQKIMNPNPTSINEKDVSTEYIKKIFYKTKLHHLPILDNKGTFIDLVTIDNLTNTSKQIDNYFYIMAGGLGKRLKQYTENTPKAMIDINGKPMIQYIIEKAASEGFKNFIISINHLGDQIKNYLKNGESLNVNIQYLEEKKPLGTAGSLSLINQKIIKNKQPIFVTNCDLMTNVKYKDILSYHSKEMPDVTVAIREHVYQNPFGVVKYKKNKFIEFDEKPVVKSFINAGIYVLNWDVIMLMKKNQRIDMTDFIHRLRTNKKNIVVFPVHEKWFDIGRPKDYEYLSILAKNIILEQLDD